MFHLTFGVQMQIKNGGPKTAKIIGVALSEIRRCSWNFIYSKDVVRKAAFAPFSLISVFFDFIATPPLLA
jgi:uncharacterized protein YodC (DUF2158 family)